MRALAAILGLLLAGPAFAQAPGTLNLVGPSSTPGAPQITTVAQVNAAVNAALGLKADALNGVLTAPVIAGGTIAGLASLGVTGPATVGGTLGVTGAATVGGGANAQVQLTPGANTSAPATISTNGLGLNLNGGPTGTSIVGGGPLNTTNGINITHSLSPVGTALNPLVNWTINLSGSTTTINPAVFQINNTGGDTLAIASPANSVLSFSNFQYNFGGAAMTGNRTALNVKATQTAQSGNLALGTVPNGPFYQPFNTAMQMNATEGGTSTGQGGSYGQAYAGGSVIRTLATATNLHEVTNWEADMNTAAPSFKKFGWKVTQLPTDIAQGVLDGAFVIENGGTSANNGWHNGFLAIQPNAQFPYATDGTLFNAPMAIDYATFNTMRNGINLEPLFTGKAFSSRGMGIDGAGTYRVGNGYLAATAGGASLDLTGSLGPAEGATISGAALVNGGTSGRVANGLMYDVNSGIYSITGAAAGVVTQLTVLRQPSFNTATPPANPISLTDSLSNAGNTTGTVQINLTWTQPNALSLNPSGGPIIMASLPTSAPATHCALWSNSGVITRSTCP
jgi:fibronectin-binding autotransporter adhesin